MKKNVYAVILAGGQGTRFWPVSRKSNPKQFLNITGKGTLLQETLARIRPLISGRHVYIVTNSGYRREIGKQVSRSGIPSGNILLEPKGKNTAPAICWAAARIHQLDPASVIVVLPSDHLIAYPARFLSVLRKAVRLAGRDQLVTLGIVPTRPETGYGYLQTKKIRLNGQSVMKVGKFREKPSLANAKEYIRHKNYFWNSGMFVWKSRVILEEYQKYLPAVYRLIGKKTGTAHIKKVWNRLPFISVDYGILEKSKRVAAVPAANIGWSDLGSWESLTDVLAKDKNGNIFRGRVVSVNSSNTLVWGNQRIIAPVGLNDVIIVDTPDALLVCRKDDSQAVKEAVTILQRTDRSVT